MNETATGAFHAQQRDVVLIGGTGAGKPHLAIGIARACIRDGAKGQFFNVVDLVNKRVAEAGGEFFTREEITGHPKRTLSGVSHL